MMGIRTPPKTHPQRQPDRKAEASTPEIRCNIDSGEQATNTSPNRKNEAIATASKRGEASPISSGKKTPRIMEAKNCLLKAMAHLGDSRNLKTEIKTGVSKAIKRLYQLVKDAEEDLKNKYLQETTENEEEQLFSTNKLEVKLEMQIRRLQEENKKLEECRLKIQKQTEKREERILSELKNELGKQALREEEREKKMEERVKTYAEVTLAKGQISYGPIGQADNKIKKTALHSVVVEPNNTTDTSEVTLQHIRKNLRAKEGGIQVERIKKAKDGKVVVGCKTEGEIKSVKQRLTQGEIPLKVKDVSNKNPLVKIKNVLSYISIEDIVESLKNQNKGITAHLQDEKDWHIAEKYRRKCRNPHENHVVLQVSPNMWRALTTAGKIHVDIQRVWVEDQSPLVQCTICLGFGHSRKFCKQESELCSHCGGPHLRQKCPDYNEGKPPKCLNCLDKGETGNNDHSAFSTDCPVRKGWDRAARQSYAYC
ncbi:unnamed protein product [Pieris macdunnoughi]|uniref:Gag-like protein n=1 Tax=Pieris macdunnoughi TaxID=345717 RepID=A0A821Y5T7_9NEOP|nr:unnamed protein product [Pieris macdunnoughi]